MFVDTNVLINARFLEAPDHEAARAGLENDLDADLRRFADYFELVSG